MAKYRVWSGGDNTGGADNTNWAQAYTTLAGAAAVATTSGDYILIHYASQEAIGADATVTLAAGVTIVAVDKDSSEAYRKMDVDGWVGTSSGAYQYLLNTAAGQTAIYGLTIRNGGTASDSISLRQVDGGACYTEDVYIWIGSTGASSNCVLGYIPNDAQAYAQHKNMTIRFSAAAQNIIGTGRVEVIGGSVSSAGTSPSLLVEWTGGDPGGAEFTWSGGDLSHATGTLAGDSSSIAATIKFVQCKLASGFTALATQTVQNRSHAEVYIVDCDDGTNRGLWGYYNALGSVINEPTIYFTSGATGWAWKVVGTSNSTVHAPFTTPWIDYQNTVNTSITPYIEIFRDASTTAYTDAQVWAEWMAKTTSGSDKSAFAGSDRQSLDAIVAGTGASNQATGAGPTSWQTGTNGVDWSGKCDSGSAFTAAEDGALRGRIAVVGAITVYVDPQIRT